MSALAISDDRAVVRRTSSMSSPDARPRLYLVPAGAPGASRGSGRTTTRAQLTDRGLLAVLVVFALLAFTSAAVIVASFFAVSNAPVGGDAASPVAAGVHR